MKAFDTDILTEILAGNPAYAERAANCGGEICEEAANALAAVLLLPFQDHLLPRNERCGLAASEAGLALPDNEDLPPCPGERPPHPLVSCRIALQLANPIDTS